MTVKFTASEKRRIQSVFDALRAELDNSLVKNNSRYDNDLGCGNCGDTGSFHGTLHRLETAFGIKHK